jgi:uncharacterized protein (DUF697 family)
MTPTLFIILFSILTIISGLITQALKKATQNSLATNLLALIDAVVTGVGGSIVAYIIMGIEFSPINVMYIIILTVAVWLGSMLGFDKIKQSIEQVIALKKD